MNYIEIFGDSLTAGNCGQSWIQIVQQQFSVKPFGMDGDTLSGIAVRCLRHLKRYSPDVLVLEAGANDVMQPYMKTKGPEWAAFISDMNLKGAVAYSEPEIFISAYQKLLNDIREQYSGPVIIMSVPLLSEEPCHILNNIAEIYNNHLQQFSYDNDIILADIYTPLADCLSGNESDRDIFHFYNEDPGLFVRDIKAVRSGISWEDISLERGLKVTVDGSHLNRRGAEVVATVFCETLKNTGR